MHREYLETYCDSAITAEYYRRIRAKKAASVAVGGAKGGWPKGKKRKLENPLADKSEVGGSW